MATRTLVVTDIDDSVLGIRTVTFADPAGATLPSFTPGSHIVIETGSAANAYSLTGPSVLPGAYTISVLRLDDGAGGSRWIHDELKIGSEVVTHEPRSAFPPIQAARRHLMIGAGIGITPLVSHLRSAATWARDVELIYVHRPGAGAYRAEIDALTGGAARIHTDRTTFTDDLLAALSNQPIGTHLYVCGPNDFMDAVCAAATSLGWPDSRIHLERFGIDALDPGEPFEVVLTNSGETFVVESGVSLLEALEARGREVPNMCRQGVCGECRIPVASGEIWHRDLYLTDDDKAAADSLMCCVSRAAGGRLEVAW